MQQLSLFRGVHDTQPRPVTLEELVTMMRTDQSVRDLTEKHRYARATGDEQGASRYKKMMTSFGVAARFEGGRQQRHIAEFTGLSLADFDHIPEERMAEVLAKVREDEHTLVAYTTISNHGVRVIYRYEINDDVNVDENKLRALLGTPPSQSDTPSINRGGVSKTPTHPEGIQPANCPSVYRGTSGTQCSGGSSKQSAEQYKQAFEHGNRYYSELVGMESDAQCKNTTRISTIAYDENVYYNPEAVAFVIEPEEKKSVGRPKGAKSEKLRVKSCKVGDVEAIICKELEQRGVTYEAGSHNKYISDACYMMNRYGVSEIDCTAWALDKFSDYHEAGNDVAAIVRSCYQQTEEHGTERPPRAEKESRYASIKDIQEWLLKNNVQIRHNVITRKREMRTHPIPPCEGGRTDIAEPNSLPHRADAKGATVATKGTLVPPRSTAEQFYWGGSSFVELTDQHVNSLYCRFCLDTGRQAKISDFYIIIESDFYPTYNPLHEYLESLPAWDGTTDYIDQLASMVHVTGCEQEMHNRFFKKWLVAMVAAWLEPDKTNHEILTYIGPQGIYKSTFVRHLLPTELSAYFSTKNFAGRMTKDDRLELTEMALVSLEELDSLNSAELNQLKAITTDPTVNERAAFARYKERRAHIASFCGTGNNPRFLTDLTDNRRWLPFLVRDIDSPWSHPLPYTGMYAQAYTLYRTGFRYWLDEEENAELKRHNRQFEEPCMEEELIATYLRVPYGDEVGEFLTATRIIELIGGAVKRPLSAKKVALCMNRLGFEQRRTKYSRGWNVIILTGNDIKEDQRLNAHRSAAE